MVFWNNLLRFPKFFFSSLIGLILILISPFLRSIGNTKDKNLIFFVCILISIFIFLTIKQMLNLNSIN
uniref:Uncharacterized protein ycf33 n=1 Tax=Schizocladia ischiensis TaxID=196139 RepID=A0A7S6UA00_9STRA|nr:Ycf33 [Schizocladia ischiensis]QOW07574.1 Ycf33 [Schizocladia ischiensis]